MTRERPFSIGLTVVSVFVYLGVELLLGDLVGNFVLGRYVTMAVHLQIQGLMHLVAYLLGGFLVGVFSPGVRMLEPAVAASISVAATLIISVFLPYRFMAMSFDRLLLGGAIAFGLALFGAYLGERLTGNVE